MNPTPEEMRRMFETVKSFDERLKKVEAYIEARKRQQITAPLDDASRIAVGLGIIGSKDTSATSASGYVTVNTNAGPMKVLVV